MTWTQYHRASEEAAMEAEQAFREGNISKAQGSYARAAEFEEKALAAVDSTKIRTRGITAVSAVSLWYKATVYERAEQLAHSLLADPSIPQFARTDLRNLVQAIWTESSKKAAHVGFLPGQVFVSVKGGDIITGGAPLDLIVEKVQTIQAIFYRTIEFTKDMPLRARGAPIREIQESCRPWLFQAVPGSYQFSVAVQQPRQLDFFKEDVRSDIVASRFLEILKATSSEDETQLAAVVSKAEYRIAFLKLARNLAPTGKTFDSIEFRSATRDASIALTPEARGAINKNLKKTRPSTAPDSQAAEEQFIGILRAVDLDRDFLDVVGDGQHFHVVGLADEMDDVIGPMVNKRVKVSVMRATTGALRLRDIELDE